MTTERTPTDIATLRAEARADLETAISTLESCTTDDEIYAWTNGLAVGVTDDGKPRICGIEDAPPCEISLYPVRNGHGEIAIRRRRIEVAKAHAADLRAALAMIPTDPA